MSKDRRYPSGRQLAARALLCGASILSLQGCFAVVATGAVVGTLAATDRRTLGAQTEDTAIMVKAETRLPNIVGDAGHVDVTSFNRKVLLTGEVRDDAMKAAVEREVGSIQNVESVVDELAVLGPSSLTSRSNDAFITGKVKAAFIDNKGLSANAIKVVTERGTVYLMGRVTENEGNLAAEIARNVSGVNKVVKVFEYISQEEYDRLNSTPDTTQNRQ